MTAGGRRVPAKRAGPAGRPPSRPSPLSSLPITFVGSFPDPLVRLDPPLPEIAFIGRSNVGKSSLLNALVGQPGLARVSGAPGKTTLLNAFRAPTFYLVDLPGYGFARASHSARAEYRKLVERYLRQRETVAGVVWLLDIRHDPSADDMTFQRLLAESGRPVLAVLTKADKLSRAQQARRAGEIARLLGLDDDQVQVTSSRLGIGMAELGETVLAAVARSALQD